MGTRQAKPQGLVAQEAAVTDSEKIRLFRYRLFQDVGDALEKLRPGTDEWNRFKWCLNAMLMLVRQSQILSETEEASILMDVRAKEG